MSVGMSTSFSSWKETLSELREVAISIQSQCRGIQLVCQPQTREAVTATALGDTLQAVSDT